MIDTVATAGMPMVATGNNGGSDMGGGQWIWAIVLIALLGGGGFGGNRGDGNAEVNGRFNALENQIQGVNAIAETRATHDMACETNLNVSKEAGMLCRDILTNQYQTSIQMKDLQMAQQNCCCETKGAIADAKFSNERNSWDISRQMSDGFCGTNLAVERGNNAVISTVMAENQKTRDMMMADKIEALRDQLNSARMDAALCGQSANIVNTLRPYPQPSYITYNPGQSFFPPQPAIAAAQAYGACGVGCGAY